MKDLLNLGLAHILNYNRYVELVEYVAALQERWKIRRKYYASCTPGKWH